MHQEERPLSLDMTPPPQHMLAFKHTDIPALFIYFYESHRLTVSLDLILHE